LITTREARGSGAHNEFRSDPRHSSAPGRNGRIHLLPALELTLGPDMPAEIDKLLACAPIRTSGCVCCTLIESALRNH